MKTMCIRDFKTLDGAIHFKSGRLYNFEKKEATRFDGGGFHVQHSGGVKVTINFSDYMIFFTTIQEHREDALNILLK